jgi:hypothetical protein
MGFMYWMRVGVMIITLGVIIMTIRATQHGESALNTFSRTFFGTKGSGGEKIVLCPTRVRSIKTRSGATVEEDSMKWYRREGENRMELNTIAVEKWLGEYCTVKGQRAPATGGSSFFPALVFEFVSGETQMLQKSSSGQYLWGDISFNSDVLDKALDALDALPAETPPNPN